MLKFLDLQHVSRLYDIRSFLAAIGLSCSRFFRYRRTFHRFSSSTAAGKVHFVSRKAVVLGLGTTVLGAGFFFSPKSRVPFPSFRQIWMFLILHLFPFNVLEWKQSKPTETEKEGTPENKRQSYVFALAGSFLFW